MEYHTICITNCELNPHINANHKRKCETYPNNYALCIMNYSGRPQGFAPTGKYNFSDVFPNNYEL